MVLVTGYDSISDSESDHSNVRNKVEITDNDGPRNVADNESGSGQKRRTSNGLLATPTQVLPKLKKVRKSPWDSWSQDDSDSESSGGCAAVNKEVNELATYNDAQNLNDMYTKNEESSHFYGRTEKDYQGRGFLHPPVEIDIDFSKDPMSFKCFLPKRIISSMNGHENGTNTLEFLPKSGHLLLSGGNDNIIRIWDFYHDRKCLRDYEGHTRPIRAIDFSSNGVLFLSASFDQSAKLWDTESGKVLSRYKFHTTPNDVKFHPVNSNEFIVGCSDSKIYHYDTRITAKQGVVQIYDHHLSSISSLRFFPDGSRFISSSEDKTVRIWENQINIPIKQISDTSQHSMPFLDIHPGKHYFCTQSMDNTIYTYSMRPKYKRHPKKSFAGQKCAGYGIGLTFSPDGRYICSGDSRSKLLIWDWTTTNLLKTINIPGNEPITQVSWNPQETSKVVCSGPTGKIFVLD